jgi:hypothetical protein
MAFCCNGFIEWLVFLKIKDYKLNYFKPIKEVGSCSALAACVCFV